MDVNKIKEEIRERIIDASNLDDTKAYYVLKNLLEWIKENDERVINMRKFKVTNEENLYGESVGELIAETSKTVILNIAGEDIVFDKADVTETN